MSDNGAAFYVDCQRKPRPPQHHFEFGTGNMQIEPGLIDDHPLHGVIGCQRFASTQPGLFTGLLLNLVLQGLAGLKRVEPPAAGSLAESDKRGPAALQFQDSALS